MIFWYKSLWQARHVEYIKVVEQLPVISTFQSPTAFQAEQFLLKTVFDPTNDNSVSGSTATRDQVLKVAGETVIFFAYAYDESDSPDCREPVSTAFKR